MSEVDRLAIEALGLEPVRLRGGPGVHLRVQYGSADDGTFQRIEVVSGKAPRAWAKLREICEAIHEAEERERRRFERRKAKGKR